MAAGVSGMTSRPHLGLDRECKAMNGLPAQRWPGPSARAVAFRRPSNVNPVRRRTASGGRTTVVLNDGSDVAVAHEGPHCARRDKEEHRQSVTTANGMRSGLLLDFAAANLFCTGGGERNATIGIARRSDAGPRVRVLATVLPDAAAQRRDGDELRKPDRDGLPAAGSGAGATERSRT